MTGLVEGVRATEDANFVRHVSQVSHGPRFSGEKQGVRATLATVHGCELQRREARGRWLNLRIKTRKIALRSWKVQPRLFKTSGIEFEFIDVAFVTDEIDLALGILAKRDDGLRGGGEEADLV